MIRIGVLVHQLFLTLCLASGIIDMNQFYFKNDVEKYDFHVLLLANGVVRFANYYQDHMVLKRAPQTQPIPNGTLVTIAFNDVLFGDLWVSSG